jgi:hypothetical protein
VIGAVSSQFVDGKRLVFGSWSDGKLPTHTVVTPSTATTFAVTYDDYVAPKPLELSSIPTQIYRNLSADMNRLSFAFNTSANILVSAAAALPAQLLTAVQQLAADPSQGPRIAAHLVNGYFAAGVVAASPMIDAVTDVIAAETIRSVGAVAALASNVIPLSATVLGAPAEITNIVVDTAVALVQALFTADAQAFFGGVALGQERLTDEFARQQGLIGGAFANVIDDVAAALAIPLPTPGHFGPSYGDPFTDSLLRTLRIGAQVAKSTLAIVGTTAATQGHVIDATVNGLGLFAAAHPPLEFIPDWVAFTLAQTAREANLARQVVAQTIHKAGADIAAAAHG